MATRRLIWDLKHESGPAQINHWSTDAGDMLERDPERYVEKLPPGVEPGPHVGVNRIIM
jgi:hypothetical protein